MSIKPSGGPSIRESRHPSKSVINYISTYDVLRFLLFEDARPHRERNQNSNIKQPRVCI